MDSPPAKTFDQWAIGDRAEFDETITAAMIEQFAALSGDRNPLHTDAAFARAGGYPSVVAHGMIGGALFSRLIGMYIPGKHALYLSQNLRFKKPTSAGMNIVVRGEITQKEAIHIIMDAKMHPPPAWIDAQIE